MFVIEKNKPIERTDKEEDSHSSEEDEEEMKKMQAAMKKKAAEKAKVGVKARAGVSAEAYGEFNKKEAFKGRIIKKTADEKIRIREKLLLSFLFKSLDEKDLEICIDAMEIKKFK